MASLIHVRNWEKFQHSDVARNKHAVVPWIRNYTALLSDDAYLSLTGHQRAVLHGIWLEYARSRAHLPLTTRSLTARLDLRVMSRDLEAIKTAGFITFTQADTLATRKQTHRVEEKREEKRLEKKATSTRLDVTDEITARREQRDRQLDGLTIGGQPVTSLDSYLKGHG